MYLFAVPFIYYYILLEHLMDICTFRTARWDRRKTKLIWINWQKLHYFFRKKYRTDCSQKQWLPNAFHCQLHSKANITYNINDHCFYENYLDLERPEERKSIPISIIRLSDIQFLWNKSHLTPNQEAGTVEEASISPETV